MTRGDRLLRVAAVTGLVALAAAGPAAGAAQDDETAAPTAGDADRERVLRLKETLASLLHGPALARARTGIAARDLRTGRELFRRDADRLLDPASNQKLLTSAAALALLGGDFRFRTEVAGPPPDADGVIRGDLVLRGDGDPALAAADLDRLAAALGRRGVARVDGAILVDPRPLDASPGAAAPARPPVRTAGRAIELRVHPGNKAGARAVVSVGPTPELFRVTVSAVTRARGRTRITVRLLPAGSLVHVVVGGRIAAGHPGLALRRQPPATALFAGALFRAALADAGIPTERPPALLRGPPPAGTTLLAVHRSLPLAWLLRRVNKDSDNDRSERLLEALGLQARGEATPRAGLPELREAVTALGVPGAAFRAANGSGLAHVNRISAAALLALLDAIATDPRLGPDLIPSLAVGAVDGTLRARLRASPAARRVRAKTGTLAGKAALSGYVGDGADRVAFAILSEGFRHRRLAQVRATQDAMVGAFMRYTQGAQGPVPIEEIEAAEAGLPLDERAGSPADDEGEAADGEPFELDAPAPTESLDDMVGRALRQIDAE